MKFFSTTFFLSNLLILEARRLQNELCLNWSNGFSIDGCTYGRIVKMVEEQLGACSHDASTELRLVTGTTTDQATLEAIDEICLDGWSTATQTTFKDIDTRFTDEFMTEYIQGEGFLNSDTGSFQGTTEGTNINNFHDNQAKSTRMNGFEGLETCALNSIMCCFGRDRQPNDNNGNCAEPLDQNCVDAGPADNSNLCYADYERTFYHGEAEGDIHCHGLAWEDDPNEFTSQLKYNNFFYVSLYDHMYQRGYVEDVINDDDIPMCACMEDMDIVVSRSDCTQVDASLTFSIKYDETNGEGLVATPQNDLEIDFNSCQGINPSNGEDQNNDLASYVYRLYLEGKIEDETKDAIFSTLVGYAEPGNNENENACKAAYENVFGCEACDDVESPWMRNVGVDCTISNLIDSKCNKDTEWITKNYCQQSCFDAGNGYSGDNCCPTPTPAPTSLPPAASCSSCDDVETPWMQRNGKDCTTTDLLVTKCNMNPNWTRNKFCQQSCYEAGNGYDGDICCASPN